MLALLHTARVHVETFERLAQLVDKTIPVRHEVREDLLTEARLVGATAATVRSAVTSAVRELAHEGANVIVCTCSTIGSLAEETIVSADVRVLRIDRPMIEQAVTSCRRVLVVAALESTVAPTTTLLRHVASTAKRPVEIVEVLCEKAWPLFEAGDHAGYVREIARKVETVARSTDQILLAQASMSPAAELLTHLGVPVLSSPRLGLEAAMAMHRAAQLAPHAR
jgi:predicted Fe-Mo cluster-binding NifX family protein